MKQLYAKREAQVAHVMPLSPEKHKPSLVWHSTCEVPVVDLFSTLVVFTQVLRFFSLFKVNLR